MLCAYCVLRSACPRRSTVPERNLPAQSRHCSAGLSRVRTPDRAGPRPLGETWARVFAASPPVVAATAPSEFVVARRPYYGPLEALGIFGRRVDLSRLGRASRPRRPSDCATDPTGRTEGLPGRAGSVESHPAHADRESERGLDGEEIVPVFLAAALVVSEILAVVSRGGCSAGPGRPIGPARLGRPKTALVFPTLDVVREVGGHRLHRRAPLLDGRLAPWYHFGTIPPFEPFEEGAWRSTSRIVKPRSSPPRLRR